VHLAKSLAVEWVDFARVNCISPGFIETESKCNLRIHSLAQTDSTPSAIHATERVVREMVGHDSG